MFQSRGQKRKQLIPILNRMSADPNRDSDRAHRNGKVEKCTIGKSSF
jgi:hypothetical protein